MSEFRIEKRRTEATLTLSTGAIARGCFFLSGSRANRSGPERVADLLNAGDRVSVTYMEEGMHATKVQLLSAAK